MYWEKEIETLDRANLEKLQAARLGETLGRAQQSIHYGKVFKETGLDTDRIRTVADVGMLPLTTKEDLREQWPYGFLACSRDELIRMHSSSGTTGRATVIFHTKGDIAAWTNLLARSMYMTGMRRSDVFQNMMTYGLFTGGLGFHYGAEKIGALVIPAGAGNSKRQIQLMRDFDTTAIHIIPSYALHLSTVFAETGVDPRRDTKLKIAFLGAEPHSEKMRQKIEELYGFKGFNSYGLSEMNGPGVAFECREKRGLHLWEDHFLMEIVDPQTGEALPDGERGELVLTTLRREAMPILRYRTRDITAIVKGRCRCGRTHRRIERITGRADDMFIVRGVNVYPQQVERVLMGVPALGRNYQIVLEALGEMTVRVELAPQSFDGRVDHLLHLRNEVVERLSAEILVRPEVALVPPGTLPVSEGKAQRVIDRRKL